MSSSLIVELAERKQFYRVSDTEAYRRFKPLSETVRQANTRENMMARSKLRNLSKRNQDYLASSEPSSLTKASIRYLNTTEKQHSDIKTTSEGIDKGL